MNISPESLLIIVIIALAFIFLRNLIGFVVGILAAVAVFFLLMALVSDLTSGTHAVMDLFNRFVPAVVAAVAALVGWIKDKSGSGS